MSIPGYNNGIKEFSRVTNASDSTGKTSVSLEVVGSGIAKTTPSIMSIEMMHTFGGLHHPGGVTSPVYQSALNLKQYISTALGAEIKSWDAGDLAVYVMAWADVLERIVEIKRALAFINTSSKYPSTLPLLGLHAAGIRMKTSSGYRAITGDDLMELAAGLPAHAARLNMLIRKVNTCPMPAEFGVLLANYDLYDKMYADTPDFNTAQLYIMRSSGYWVYDETTIPNMGASLAFHYWATDDHVGSIGDMLIALNRQVSAIITNSESYHMMQMINNAYGNQSARYLTVDEFDAQSTVGVAFDPLMLVSIENANLVSDLAATTIVSAPAPNYLLGAPYVPSGDPGAKGACITLPLNLHVPEDQVTDELIARALRFHPLFEMNMETQVYVPDTSTTSAVRGLFCNDYCGFAIPGGARVYYWNITGSGELTMGEYSCAGKTDIKSYDQVMSFLSFNQAPPLVYSTIATQGNAEDGFAYQVDVKSYTTSRDLELTLDKDRLRYWFIAMTERMWAAREVRQTRGQREMNG